MFLSACLLTFSVVWAQRTVSGTVTDAESGDALEGVAVLVQGTTVGMFTNSDGKYSLQVPAGGETLVFTYVGRLKQEVPIEGRSTINIAMVTDALQIEEVVVTGYGAQTRKTLTTSIARVTAEEVKGQPLATFDQMLQGRAAGVNINANSGTLGAASAIRVRGVGSVNASNQPLIVIDGVPFDAPTGSALGGPGTSPLVNINPNDIESFEILKDAAATALFGARATNGVILITTKSGQAGKPRVEVNYYGGFSEPTALFDLMDGNEYAQLWNRAGRTFFTRNGLPAEAWDDPDTHAAVFGPGAFYKLTEGEQPTTDWQDLVTRRAFLQETNASVSGGDENTKYYLAATYRDEDGYVRRTNFKRYAVRLNVDQRVNDRLNVGLSLNPSRSVNTRLNEDNNVASPITYAALAFPNVNAFDDDGVMITPAPRPENRLGQFNGNPLINLEGADIVLTTTQLAGNTYADLSITPDLRFRTEFGVLFTQLFETYRAGEFTTDGFPIGVGSAFSDQILKTVSTSYFNYNRTFDLLGVDVTLGTQFENYDRQEINVDGNTFADDRLKTLSNAAEITGGGGTGTQYAFQNNFIRANFSYNARYLLGLVASYNGSSRFGSNTRYGLFPAISAGYIISEEDFLKGNRFINFLKLRASFGITGNAEIGNFASRGLVSFGRDYNRLPGYELSQLGNPDLSWETARQFDAALEFGLLNSRVRGSFGFYNKVTEGLLFDVPQPLTTGIATSGSATAQNDPAILQNVGRVLNQGFELDLNADIIKTSDFTWSIGGNLATLRNEVLELPDNDNDGESDDIFVARQIIRVGQPLGAFYLVEYAGVDPENGNALFWSLDENDMRDTAGSGYSLANRVIAGSPLPTLFGGFSTSVRFKGFELSGFFVYSVGNDIYRAEARFTSTNMGATWNQTRDQLGAWTPDNPNTDIPEARLFTVNGSQHSTRYLEDASFLRLRTATLAYTFPKNVLGDVGLRVFVQGQNLLTFTQYGGLDPEANGVAATSYRTGDVFFSRPQARVVTAGLTATF